MCGIFAILHPERSITASTLDDALTSLRHRGPDDHGLWSDTEAGVTLGQTRLSIQDTSSAGHQPMLSSSGRFVIVFNGEIYNHPTLRQTLERVPASDLCAAITWRGHSDTETLLSCIEHWGLRRTLEAVNGMFAFCLWDRELRQLHLARDRIGEKPLYYGHSGGYFAVASEVRTFRVLPDFNAPVDRRSLALMMRFGAVPAPQCIYEGFFKLEPGTSLRIDLTQAKRRETPAPREYWSAPEMAQRYAAQESRFDSDEKAVDGLRDCLAGAVSRQLISDVPLGAFLSGGIDSSIVVALMQAETRRLSGDPIRTFSIGFNEPGYNEAQHAKLVAAHLRTDHTELYVGEAECLELVPKLASIYDEPFADSSQIAVCLVSRMARRHVTVALTGDGGDEVFGGYNRYTRAARWWRRMNRIPEALRKRASQIISHVPAVAADRLAGDLSRLLPIRLQIPRPGERLEKLARMLACDSAHQMYLSLVECWNPAKVMLGPVDAGSTLDNGWSDLLSMEAQMMMLDLTFVLPTDMLTKVDRAAMAVSLETRVPFLDPAVMEFAWRLPMHYKIRGTQGKWLVRQLLYRYVPPALVERPKMGFDPPVSRWLKGTLRDWAESLINERTLREEGFFNAAEIRQRWEEHLSGRRDHATKLWAVLMFQSWHHQSRSGSGLG